MMRMTVFFSFTYAVLGAAVSAADAPAAGAYGDAVATAVRDRIVTFYELREMTRQQVDRLERQQDNADKSEQLEKLLLDATDRIVEGELVYAEFEDLGAEVPVTYLQQNVDRSVLYHSGGDREQFERELVQQGTAPAEFRQQQERQLAVDLLLQERVYRHVHVSPRAVAAFYRDHPSAFRRLGRARLQAIVLKRDGSYAGKLEETVAQLREDVARGTDYGALARQYSEDPTAASGGDLGWSNVTDLDPKFREAIQGLQPGDLAPTVVLAGNVCLLRLAEYDAGGALPLDDALREQIESQLRAREERARRQRYVGELKDKYYVENFAEIYFVAAESKLEPQAGEPQSSSTPGARQ